jgi:hypothetical protein
MNKINKSAQKKIINTINNCDFFVKKEPLKSFIYLPSDFNDEKYYLYMSFEIGKHKKIFEDILKYWLHSLFNFLEDIYKTEMFKKIAAKGKNQKISDKKMIKIINDLFKKLKNPPDFNLNNDYLRLYEMLNEGGIISYVGETDKFFFSFFCMKEDTKI